MKKIKLTKDKFAIVDDNDFQYLNQFRWYFSTSGYATRDVWCKLTRTKNKIRMHREILGLKKEDNDRVDHVDGDKLDNRKLNLRRCSHAQNCQNRPKQSNNTSGYKGVYFHKQTKRWNAKIGKRPSKSLGLFVVKEEAARAYDEEAKNRYGEFANLNFGSCN
jgi:hypothetical protein